MVETISLRITISLAVLIYASYLDLRYREIDPRLWRSMTAAGILLLAADLFQTRNTRLLTVFAIVLAIAVGFSVSLHYLGLMGGGDSKLLIALGAMFPLLPEGNFVLPIFFLSVFSNGVLIALIAPLIILVQNLRHFEPVRSPHDILRLFTGYRKDARNLGPFEVVVGERQLFFNVRKAELGKSDAVGEVWVTPAIPFVVFLTAGFLLSVTYGDLLSIIF